MAVIAWIVGLALIIMMGGSGAMKLMDHQMAQDNRKHLGLTAGLSRAIGGAEVAAAVGFFIGLLVDDNAEWIGALAAIGVIFLMIGAVIYHQRAGDEPKALVPAIVVLVLAIVYFVTFGQVGS